MIFSEEQVASYQGTKREVKGTCHPTPKEDPDQIQNSISCLAWNSNSSKMIPSFLATNWQGQLKHYRVILQNDYTLKVQSKVTENYPNLSLLKCCWSSQRSQIGYCGDNQGVIHSYNFDEKKKQGVIGMHKGAISSLQYLQGCSLLASSGYQNQVKFWDERIKQPALNLTLPFSSKVHCATHNSNYIAYGLSNYKIVFIDLRQGQHPLENESPLGLNSQIQSIALHPSKNILAVGSFDGRVVLTPILENQSSTGHLAHDEAETFRLHFKEIKNNNEQFLLAYPVNVIGFSPSNENWLFSASADCNMAFTDFIKGKKIKRQKVSAPFTAAAINNDGGLLVYATGNDWHTGANESWSTDITVKIMTSADYYVIE